MTPPKSLTKEETEVDGEKRANGNSDVRRMRNRRSGQSDGQQDEAAAGERGWSLTVTEHILSMAAA